MLVDEALSSTQVFRCRKDFKNDRESVGHERRSERPIEARTYNTMFRVCALSCIKNQDRRLTTVRMLTDELNLKRETVRKMSTDYLSPTKDCQNVDPS